MIYLLQHTISNSAKCFPNREAFKCGQTSLTFKEMEAKMNRTASLLHELGVKKGDRVGIYLNRSIETAIAIYGVLCAGAIYVPLNPKAPVARSRFLIKDCDIQILITHPSQKRTVKTILEEETTLKAIIGLKEEWNTPTIPWAAVNQRDSNFSSPFPILENDPAYIIYTSGSTGIPKGIVHTHFSGLSYAKLTADLYGLTERDRIGNHAPIHFDISTLGYFTAPFVGACTVIIPEAYILMTASLTSLIEKEKLTVWYSVPLALIQMLQKGLLDERDMTALQWVLYGGEPFTPKHLRDLMLKWPQTRFSNVYGPAEVNQCTYYHLPKPPEINAPVPLGQVWKNSEMLIMDENDQQITDDTPGELFIRSSTMMLGYWKNPNLTNASIYKRKGRTSFEECFYRTGDLVQLHKDGHLLFLGRKDRQVKIRGYRVELDEIETTLLTHEAVVEAAVIITKEEENTRLHAVVITHSKEITEAGLRQFLKKQLPAYAIPEVIKMVSTFPRSSSGKIDRKALETMPL